jgi:hypothetical protein
MDVQMHDLLLKIVNVILIYQYLNLKFRYMKIRCILSFSLKQFLLFGKEESGV